jgi:serine/threonine protein kinase
MPTPRGNLDEPMGAPSPSPSPEERVPIGSILDGRYRIDAVLGSGGMGRVYRGEHTGIGRAVAIKVLHADLSRNSDAANRFRREALASGRLDHPNIVRVDDSGFLDDGGCYLVMEALEGEPLGDRLTREKRLHWREALAILRDVLQGLHHAHERGVVHRDVKPDNIFLAKKDGKPIVKILDFGIAKLYQGSADDPASTRAGLTVGTPAYLSPEQAVGGEITPASDIYSSTIVLYEMVTGRAPFEDRDPLAMLGAHVSRQPPAIADVAPDIVHELPPGFEDMIMLGLAKAPAERIASGEEYIKWIDAVLAAAPHAQGSAPVQVPLGAMIDEVLAPPGGVIATPPANSIARIPAAPSHAITPVPTNDASFIGLTSMIEAIAPGELSKQTPAPARADEANVMATRTVTLADVEPVPRKWLLNAIIVLGLIAATAIILALVMRGEKQPDAKPELLGAASPASDSGKTKVTVPKDDDKQKLKALIQKLEKGKTCEERRSAIPDLVELGDPEAIPKLKQHRHRWHKCFPVVGCRADANACLTKDAEAAIQKLTPPT